MSLHTWLARFLGVLLSAVLFFSWQAKAQDNEQVIGQIEGESGLGTEFPRFGLSYFNLATSDFDRVNYGNSSWFMYQYLQFIYKTSYTERFSFRYAFQTLTPGPTNTFGSTTDLKTTISDPHITYANYEIATLPFDFDLSGTFYLYFPATESSQNKKWTTRARAWLIANKPLNPYWTVSYHAKPEYYFNTQKAYRSSGSTPKANNNQQAGLEHYVEVSRYFNKTFVPKLAVGFKHAWYEDSNEVLPQDARPSLETNLTIAPGTWIYLNPQLKFILQVQNTIPVSHPNGRAFGFFREDQTEYMLFTFWNIM